MDYEKHILELDVNYLFNMAEAGLKFADFETRQSAISQLNDCKNNLLNYINKKSDNIQR